MYIVYVLKSLKVQKTYTGFTRNLERRLEEHNAGKSLYTRRYMPWKIVYAEEVDNRETARKREKYFKSAAGRRHLKKLFKENC